MPKYQALVKGRNCMLYYNVSGYHQTAKQSLLNMHKCVLNNVYVSLQFRGKSLQDILEVLLRYKTGYSVAIFAGQAIRYPNRRPLMVSNVFLGKMIAFTNDRDPYVQNLTMFTYKLAWFSHLLICCVSQYGKFHVISNLHEAGLTDILQIKMPLLHWICLQPITEKKAEWITI